MSNRFKRPAPGQPDPAKLAVYLSDVRQRTDERRRVAAVHALHALLQRWRAEARTAEAVAMAAHAAVFEPLPPGTPPKVVRKKRGKKREPFLLLLAVEPARQAQAETAAIEAAIQQRREHWIAPPGDGGLGAPRHFDRMLRAFFEHAGRAIFASPDPLAAMRGFWKGNPWRVRKPKAKKAERDLALAVAVQERVDAGKSIEAAIGAVAAEARTAARTNAESKPRKRKADGADDGFPSDESVHKIYYRLRDKICLDRAWPALVESWRSGQEWDWGAFVKAPLPEPE
jgi:hypothetical protein